MLITMLRRPWTKKKEEEEETLVVPSLSKSRGLIREALKISPWIFPNFMTSSPFRLSNIGTKLETKFPRFSYYSTTLVGLSLRLSSKDSQERWE